MRSIDVYIKDETEYLEYVSDILNNSEFQKLESYVHHNSNRLQHSLNVSFYSYKISKLFNLDSKKVARASLLHDFFLIDNLSVSKIDRFKTLFLHPRKAHFNSSKYYFLSDMEQNIILSHMFPIGLDFPRYKESLLVDLVDDYVAIYEAVYAKRNEISAALTYLFIFIVNFSFRRWGIW